MPEPNSGLICSLHVDDSRCVPLRGLERGITPFEKLKNPEAQGIFRKEVIQPHLPVRLPCYDLAPVTDFTLGLHCWKILGTLSSHRLTGGVYKARERIHGGVADPPLLAIPASRSRIADSYLN